MNKKLLAVAVAAVVSAPAFAQSSDTNVTVYGQVNVGFEVAKLSNGGVTKNRVEDYYSHLGFKGQEALGNGLKAVWQIESGFDPSGTANAGANTSGRIASRNTFVGLTGGFGTVIMGRHDTPYKMAASKLDVMPDTAGYNAVLSAKGSFDLRADNAIAYLSPNYNGFDFKVAYVANEGKAKVGNTTTNPNAWSLSATYDANNIFATVAYERHKDFTGTLTSDVGGNAKDEKGLRFGAGYTLGDLMVGGVYEQLRATGGTADVKRNNGYLVATYGLGNTTLMGTYGKAGKAKVGGNSLSETDAKYFALGAEYSLSKRTSVFGIYTKVDNKKNASFDLSSSSAGLSPVNGQDPSAFGFGIKHSF